MLVNNRHASQSAPGAVEELAQRLFIRIIGVRHNKCKQKINCYTAFSVRTDTADIDLQDNSAPLASIPPPTLDPLPPGLPYTSSVSLATGTPGRLGCGTM